VLVGAFALRAKSVHWRLGFFVAIVLVGALVSLRYGGYVRLLMFIAGVLLYEVTHHRLFRAAPGAVLAVALVLGFVSTQTLEEDPVGMVVRLAGLFVAFFLLCHTCFTVPDSVFTRFFSWTPLRWLGNFSYSYYLAHGLALKTGFTVLRKVVPPHPQGPGFYVVMMAVMFCWTLVPSVFVFLFVERPFSLAPKRGVKKSVDAQPPVDPESVSLANAPAAD